MRERELKNRKETSRYKDEHIQWKRERKKKKQTERGEVVRYWTERLAKIEKNQSV